MVKNLPADAGDAGDVGLISGSGRSPGARKLHPTPIFLPGKFHGQRSLEGFSPWGCKESHMTEHTLTHTRLRKRNYFEHSRQRVPGFPLSGQTPADTGKYL